VEGDADKWGPFWSGVTLGLAASAGGLTAPLLGWLASATSLTTALAVAACVPAPAAIAVLLLPAGI
jgi:MFS transporter, FSR family, fosmidomycin resistance protein